jgi:hypothetical protein
MISATFGKADFTSSRKCPILQMDASSAIVKCFYIFRIFNLVKTQRAVASNEKISYPFIVPSRRRHRIHGMPFRAHHWS